MYLVPSTDYSIRTVAVFAAAYAISFCIWKLVSYRQQHPPHPNPAPSLPSVPILGTLPFLGKLDFMHIYLTEKAAEIGSVFTLHLGTMPCTVINGRRAIHEALVKKSPDFADRPVLFTNFAALNPKSDGIIDHKYDPDFKKYHQMSLKILKEFGFGQNRVTENRIRLEVEDLISFVESVDGKAFSPDVELTSSVLNVIASIIFGRRFDRSLPELRDLIESLHSYIRTVMNLAPVNPFPFLRFVPSFRRHFTKCRRLHKEMFDFIERNLKDSLEQGNTTESFARYFIKEEGEGYDWDQLHYTIRDLLLAGTETSTTTLLWAFAFVASRPEAQKRLQQEIDSVVGTGSTPSYDDRSKMPYVEAFILELMRLKTLVPLSIPHATYRDAEIDGFHIPAKRMVLINLYSIHMDPTEWPEPHEFKPERFLDSSGKVTKRECVVPFSLGRRSCLGEVLARQEIFLFLTGLLQKFDFRPVEGQTEIDCATEIGGVTVAPKPYQIRLISRKSSGRN